MLRRTPYRTARLSAQRGVTLLELVVTMAIGSLVIAGLNGILSTALASKRTTSERNGLARDARFAMDRMVRAVSHSPGLLLPLADNPNTTWREHVRAQTVPASAPESGSSNATAVLAVKLPAYSDLNFDGIPDADNDADGKIDEDIGHDNNNDGAPGILGIDDDGDGLVDETNNKDDDEDQDLTGNEDEDPINGIDDDGDGAIDEDFNDDMNDDGESGLAGIDDDGDGTIDESISEDDDEDEDNGGDRNEDGFDSLVFYLANGDLIERVPVPWDEDTDGFVTGTDYIESVIAENVTQLRFERLTSGSRYLLVDITLEITGAGGQSVTLTAQMRVGGAL